MQKIYEVLKNVFGHQDFHGVQKEVINRALQGDSSLVIMPTGFGKSLCYQLPSEILPGLTLVISPLIALMKDQVDGALKKGLKASFINSSLKPEERKLRYKKLAKGEYNLLYVTPERFKKEEFRSAVSQNQVSLLAIDEAHCISEWGHDFRPDYTRIKEFVEFLNGPPVMALTATATTDVQKDIIQQIGKEDIKSLVYGIERPNLFVQVESVYGDHEKIQHIVSLLHKHAGTTIIYFSLISTLEKFSQMLSQLNIEHLQYHGRLSDKLRKKNQDQFVKGECPLILATPAFGLGVDKSNVRQVIHVEVPGSVEAYYQEIGRAGRDGKSAYCTLLFDSDDISIQMDFVKWANPDPEFIRSLFQLIRKNQEKVKSLGLEFLREKMNFYNSRDFRLETALNLLERWDCISFNQKKYPEIIGEIPEDFLEEGLYTKRLKKQNEKLFDMLQYTKLEECRKQYIYKYFGIDHEPCGFCDNCEEG